MSEGLTKDDLTDAIQEGTNNLQEIGCSALIILAVICVMLWGLQWQVTEIDKKIDQRARGVEVK